MILAREMLKCIFIRNINNQNNSLLIKLYNDSDMRDLFGQKSINLNEFYDKQRSEIEYELHSNTGNSCKLIFEIQIASNEREFFTNLKDFYELKVSENDNEKSEYQTMADKLENLFNKDKVVVNKETVYSQVINNQKNSAYNSTVNNNNNNSRFLSNRGKYMEIKAPDLRNINSKNLLHEDQPNYEFLNPINKVHSYSLLKWNPLLVYLFYIYILSILLGFIMMFFKNEFFIFFVGLYFVFWYMDKEILKNFISILGVLLFCIFDFLLSLNWNIHYTVNGFSSNYIDSGSEVFVRKLVIIFSFIMLLLKFFIILIWTYIFYTGLEIDKTII